MMHPAVFRKILVVGQNSVGSGLDVNFTYRRVSVGLRHRAPLLSIVPEQREMRCDVRHEAEEHTGSDRPCDALGISLHVHAADFQTPDMLVSLYRTADFLAHSADPGT